MGVTVLAMVFRRNFQAGRLRLLGCVVLLLVGPSAGLGCGAGTSRHRGAFFTPEALRQVALVIGGLVLSVGLLLLLMAAASS